jgi:hypothetical protein
MLSHTVKFAWAAFLLALAAVGRAPASQRFPGVLLSTFVFAAVLTWLPRCRPLAQPLICPWNWALFVFALQLIGLPLLITLDRPSLGVLPSLPSSFAINLAMALDCVAFLTVCTVYDHCMKLRTAPPDELDVMPSAAARERYGSTRSVLAAALLGIVGLVLSFGNIAGILDYFNDPGFYRTYFSDMSSTARGLAAMLFKPFLGFAVVMTWCRWIDRGGKNSSWLRRSVLTILMLSSVVISFGSVSYNRGAFAVPLVAVATVAVARGDMVSRRMIVTIGVLILGLMPVYAIYRSGAELGENLFTRSDLPEMLMDNVDISDTVQMYGTAPQYLGFLLERGHWGTNPRWGELTVSSILSPVPVLGKSFRQNSGFTVYNQMIYGTNAIADQYTPFSGETFMDFHIVGVVFGYGMLGWVLYRLQRAFERARSSLEVYIWQYLSVWICFVIFGSIDVISQILIYSCWPIYLFWISRQRSRRSPPSGPIALAAAHL